MLYYDIAIIGGGIVGAMTARELSRYVPSGLHRRGAAQRPCARVPALWGGILRRAPCAAARSVRRARSHCWPYASPAGITGS